MRIVLYVVAYTMLVGLALYQYLVYGFEAWVWNWEPHLLIGNLWGILFLSIAIILNYKKEKEAWNLEWEKFKAEMAEAKQEFLKGFKVN